MAILFRDNAASTIASGITAVQTTITVATGTGPAFPAPTGSDYFELTLTNAGYPETSWEIVKVTGRTGDVLTVVRGWVGTAAAWSAGAKAEQRVTASLLAQVAMTTMNQTYTVAQRGGVAALTSGATITPDFNASNFFSLTLATNATLANPTNLTPGQSGCIFITQDATGSRTLAYGSYWDFANGAAPTLSTAAGTVDRLDYVVRSSTSIHAVLSQAWS